MSTKQKKICIAGFFPPPITGQAMATDRLCSLLSDDFKVDKINLSPSASIRLETSSFFNLKKIKGYREVGKRLSTALKADEYDAILWPSISPQFSGHIRDRLTILPAFPEDIPLYGIVHWGNFHRVFTSTLTRFSASKVVNRMRGIVFLDPLLASKCTPWVPANKRFCIPNAIQPGLECTDTEVREKQLRRHPAEPQRLLFLGNMIESKGYWDVLEAVKLLKEHGSPCYLELAGRWLHPSDKQRFDTFVAQNNLGEWVTHHGTIADRETIKNILLRTDLLVFPTYYPTEASPLVIPEALNAGIPIITTKHAGIPEMVTENIEALFVKSMNPQDIKHKVALFSDRSKWLQFSIAARKRFLAQFDAQVVRDHWRRLLL